MVKFIKRDSGDIFKNPLGRFLFKDRSFLFILRSSVVVLFFYGIFMGFYDTSKENIFTTALFWGIFWPFFIVTTLPLFGRIFCGICPHGFLGKYITKVGLNRSMPKWLKNRFIGLMLLFLGWWGVYYTFPGVFRTPLGTAVLFSVMTAVAFLFYFLYKEMAYCKYICPIGTVLRGYSKLSFTWFGSYNTACSDCRSFDCARSCPYGLSPFNFNKKGSMDDCTLCMECTHSCEAINFRFVKPGYAIYKRFKPLKAEVWGYILILAAIPISMAFHHGLGRSNIGDSMPWAKSAAWLESLVDLGSVDTTGMFAFVYAALLSVASAVVGMWIAAKILKKEFDSVFYTLGYAFAPLFILASMAHAWEFFFTSNSARIVEGIAWGFGFDLDVDPLAKRGDSWLMIFHAFRWLAVGWALYILYRRFRFIEASKLRKAAAFPFAALLILFFVGVNLYRDYVIDTYGRKPRAHHMGAGHASDGRSRSAHKVDTLHIMEAEKIWLTDKSPYGMGRSGMRGADRGVPKRSVWLMGGDFEDPKCLAEDGGRFLAVDADGRVSLPHIERGKCTKITFKMPKSGYYNIYYLYEGGSNVKVARYEFKRFDHGEHPVYDRLKMAAKSVEEVPIDLLRLRPEDETFYSRLHTGEEVRFRVLKGGKPVEGAAITLTTQFGWQKSAKSDSDGIVKFRLIKDYYPEWERYNRRFRERFLVAADFDEGSKRYEATYFGTFTPAASEYRSYAYGLVVALLILIAASGAVFWYRMRLHRPFKEVKIDEKD